MNFFDGTIEHNTYSIKSSEGCIRLRSKLWDLLIELEKNKERLVSRDYLVKKIWNGNLYTGEKGLTHSICHLRSVFKELSISAEITTIPKKGYILHAKNKMLISKSLS